MIIACPACATRYSIPDGAIAGEGRTVRCAKCRHSWFQPAPGLEPDLSQAEPEPIGAAPVDPSPPPSPPDDPAAHAAAPHGEPEAAPSETATQAKAAAAIDEPDAAQAHETPAAPDVAEPEGDAPDDAGTNADEPVDGPDAAGPFAAPRAIRDRAAIHPEQEPAPVVVDAEEDAPSRFAHEAPFVPRRDWGRIGLYASIVFAIVTLALAGAIAWGGLPDWVPWGHRQLVQEHPDLVLDFPADRQDYRPLPGGGEFFGASGSVRNIGAQTRYVPTILIVLRDKADRVVYSWEVVPPKRQLAPGETMSINEAMTDVPKSAVAAEFGWKPS